MMKHQGKNIPMKKLRQYRNKQNFWNSQLDDIEKGINSSYSKQKKALNVVHTWAKDYVQ